MANRGLFSVTTFARLARTTRNTLHFYEKRGLLIPAFRDENKYRYYSINQLSSLNLIRTLQSLGMSLSEIESLKDRRTPELVLSLLKPQIKGINLKIKKWKNARSLLLTLQAIIASTENIDEQAVMIHPLP